MVPRRKDGRSTRPYYLLQAAYAAEFWATQTGKNPTPSQSRSKSCHRGSRGEYREHLAFGEYGAVAIAQFPDYVSDASLTVACLSSGVAMAFETTHVLTIEEGMEMMGKAGGSGTYHPAVCVGV